MDNLNEPLVDSRFIEDLSHNRKRPAWVTSEPIVQVGAWEPLFHRRRMGTSWVEDEKFYAYEHSERFVKEILAIGGTILVTAFEKNYHIDEEELPLKKQLVALCKKHGLRMAVYIRADQIYSEVFADRLSKQDLLAHQADGRVPVYHEWRKNICFHKPANIEAFKQSIRRAVVELGVDLLHLDGFGVGGTETYGACRCDACRRDFTVFLQRRWGDDPKTCKRRFGHTHLDAIEPPGAMASPAIPTGRVGDPVWQEWIRFRCTWTTRIARLISEYTYELNPNVAILGNNSVGVRENCALLCGYDPATYCQYVDIMCNEDSFDARLGADGKIIQRTRQHKMIAPTGAWLWNYMNYPVKPEREMRIQLAHAAAFNRGRVTCMGFPFALCYNDFRLGAAPKRQFTEWLNQNWAHFQNLETISDVAVWRESRAMAFAEPITYATAMRVEQLLIEDRIPFSIALGDWSCDARVLVLPNLAFLDDAQCRRLVAFVKQGGSLLVIGESSILDGWGRRRTDFGLCAVLPDTVKMPGWVFNQPIAGANDLVEPGRAHIIDKQHWTYHQVGEGRIVYIPELVDPATQPSLFNPDNTYNFGLDLTNWRVPEKADEFRRALAWLLANRPSFAVEAERGVLANYYHQTDSDRLYTHLVNLKDQLVANTKLRVELPPSKKVEAVRVLTPDGVEGEKMEWRIEGNTLVASLEALDVYAVIVIEGSVFCLAGQEEVGDSKRGWHRRDYRAKNRDA